MKIQLYICAALFSVSLLHGSSSEKVSALCVKGSADLPYHIQDDSVRGQMGRLYWYGLFQTREKAEESRTKCFTRADQKEILIVGKDLAKPFESADDLRACLEA